MATLILPALNQPDHEITTPAGRIRVPGQRIAEKRVEIHDALLNGLLDAARSAAAGAHAPYSHFHVGAAVVMADDPEQRIITGANIENSSYGATVCGERNAIFQAAALGFRRIRYLAVSTADSLDGPIEDRSPCGICRQVINDFARSEDAADDAIILIDTAEPGVLCEALDIERLLPHGFVF